MKHTYLISRLATMSLFLVLFVLAGFSVGTAVHNQQITSAVESSTYTSELFRQAVYTLATEEALQYEYSLKPSPLIRNEHLAAATTIIALLQRLQHIGDRDDATYASQVIAEQARYMLAATQFFAAVDAHNLAQARVIHYQSIDVVFDQIKQQLRTKADQEQAVAAYKLVQLSQVQHMIFMTTPLIFALGLLTVSALWWIIASYRKKIDQAMQVEMVRLERLALSDPLTDLGNHHAYQEHLSHALQETHGDGDSLVLALLDLDEFKLFNDERGYQCGDEVLLACAALLREAHLSDALFRLSGDDFALLISQTPLEKTCLALNHFREDVERHALGITVSIGMASAAFDKLDRELLYAQATAALAEAKRRGRNRVLSFEAIKGSVSLVSSAKIQTLRRLLSEPRLTVAFQPIWDLTTGTVRAFEALTRPAADYGFAGPQEMFDIAEQIGRAHELDVICVRAILARAADLPATVLLFLNLTPQTLVHDLLTGATLLEAVVSAGLTPARVVLEITERSIVNLTEVVQKVKFLRLMGFRVALDDAGAGNAGLEMLSQLSVDYVKIDRDVVSRALTDRAASSVLTGIVTIARESQMFVVAEGIENPEMLAMVQQLHVQCAQGYLLGRPSETIPGVSALQDLNSFLYTSTSSS